MLLALSACSMVAMASETTVNATMKLMKQGINQVQSGFLMNSKKDIIQGVQVIENSNAIFTHVDVADFVKSNKVTVAKNINENLTNDLKAFKKAVETSRYTEATQQYAKVLNECVTCHTIIRTW